MDAKSVVVLDVFQNELEIQVTKTMEGKPVRNVYRLDGSMSKYVSEGGVPGICRARFKAKSMILESEVVTQPQHGVDVRTHTREQWTLSADRGTLTVNSKVESSGAGLGPIEIIPSWAEIYTRKLP